MMRDVDKIAGSYSWCSKWGFSVKWLTGSA